MALQTGQCFEEPRIVLADRGLGGEEEARDSQTGDEGLGGEEGRGLRLSLTLRVMMMSFGEGEEEDLRRVEEFGQVQMIFEEF